jgi:radical SAM protein with 4Fe4S-binding SPASM domain
MGINNKKYQDFSSDLHSLALQTPLACQMELTYLCPLHCQHCYTDCYNNKTFAKNDLSTKQIKIILNKCKKAGVIWLCLTGGDPLIRKDFVEIYTYASKLGFIITVFSSLTIMNKEILNAFKKYPPFMIQTTVNATNAKKYKEITGTTLFSKQIDNMRKLLKNNLSLISQTLITKQNIYDINRIKQQLESLGLKFRPSTLLQAKLDHNTSPCALRVEPQDVIKIWKKYGLFEEETKVVKKIVPTRKKQETNRFLACNAGQEYFWINTQGEIIICGSLRTQKYSLLLKNASVRKGLRWLNNKIQKITSRITNGCRTCKYRIICKWCPGRAYLERNNLGEPINYFCKLTKQTLKTKGIYTFVSPK